MEGKALRILFMGTPEFAVASLKALVDNGYHVVGVITAPDRPAGRGQQIHQSDVKQYAIAQKIPVLQPEKLKDENFLADLRKLKADLQIVVAFRMLPEVVWAMPRLGTFNLHGSLLPLYRGAAPLNWAIINGEQETGVTTFLLNHEIDTGHILFKESIAIGPEDTVGDIHDTLMAIGARLVLQTTDALAKGDFSPIPQDVVSVSPAKLHAPKIFKENCRINWSQTPQQIHNLIRGLSPYPTAWTNLEKEGVSVGLKIFKSSPEEKSHALPVGTLVSDHRTDLKIACQGGFIKLLELQQASKKKMGIAEFLRGFPEAEDYSAR